MVDVFISYSRSDQAMVAMLAHAVEAAGYQVWWDAELPPHQSYGDVITDKIAGAKAAIVVWSASAVKSEWVRAEADMARNQRKLIQTALDDVTPPLPFNQIQYAEMGDWRGEDDHPAWRKVKISLADLCGREAPAPPAARPGSAMPPPAYAVPPPQPGPSGNKGLVFGLAGVAAVAVAVAIFFAVRPRQAPTAAPPSQAASSQANDSANASFDTAATVEDPDGFTNVREGPSLGDRIVGRVQVGAPFQTYRQSGTWWRVRLPDGTTGWVARSRIRLPGESSPTQAVAAVPAAVSAADDTAPPEPNAADLTFPDSSTRLLQPSEVYPLGPATLKVARNEIFARKGMRFRTPFLQQWFGRYAWYRPRFDRVQLNPIERANVELIRQAEARYGG